MTKFIAIGSPKAMACVESQQLKSSCMETLIMRTPKSFAVKIGEGSGRAVSLTSALRAAHSKLHTFAMMR